MDKDYTFSKKLLFKLYVDHSLDLESDQITMLKVRNFCNYLTATLTIYEVDLNIIGINSYKDMLNVLVEEQ